MNLETNSCTLFGWCWWFFCCRFAFAFPLVLAFGAAGAAAVGVSEFAISTNALMVGRFRTEQLWGGSGRTNLTATTHQLRQSLSRWSNCCFSCCWNFCCLLLRTSASASTPKADAFRVIWTITVWHWRWFRYYCFYLQPKLKVPEIHHQLCRKNKPFSEFSCFCFGWWRAKSIR